MSAAHAALEALKAQSFFSACPEAVGIIANDGQLVASNPRFERTVGPAKVLHGADFLGNCIQKEEHTRFNIAMQRARHAQLPHTDASLQCEGSASDVLEWALSPTIRNCATIALGSTGDFPIWRKMDWTLSVFDETRLIMTGRPTDSGPAALSSAEPKGADEQPYFEPPSERELLDFLNKAPIAMHWLSGTGNVLWANETEMNVLGYTPEEYIGKPIMNFCPDETPLVLEIFKSLGSGNAIKDVPVRFRTKDGRIKHLLIDSNVNWNADGSFKHTRCFIRDDTLRKVREERLRVTREKETELSSAKDIFFRKIFHEIRTPSHMLASSMAALEQWMAENSSGREGGEAIKAVSKDWKKLLALVDDAADASLFHLGKVPVLRPHIWRVSEGILEVCNEVVRDCLVPTGVTCMLSLGHGDSKAVPFSASSQSLQWDHAAAFDDRVKLDKARVLRVVRMLAVSALERTGDGGGVRDGSAVRIRATFWPETQMRKAVYTISVSDTGASLDPIWVQNRFRNYFHVTPPDEALVCTGTSADAGVGSSSSLRLEEPGKWTGGCDLGLYVAFNLAETLGGSLECSSNDNNPGTTFTLTIPARTVNDGASALQTSFCEMALDSVVNDIELDYACSEWTDVFESALTDQHVERLSSPRPPDPNHCSARGSDNPASPPAAAAATAKAPPPPVGIAAELKRRPHVLIADPNLVSQRVASKLLRSLNCSVELAGNGVQALQLLSSHPECYDAALMDLNMPVINGMDCAKLIQQDARLASVGLVVLTGEGDMTRQEVEEMGFHGLLRKPLARQSVEEELERILRHATLELRGLEAGMGVEGMCGMQQGQSVMTSLKALLENEEHKAQSKGQIEATITQALGKEASKPKLPSPANSLRNKAGSGACKCLIVEDNAVCMRVATKMMEKLGFVVEQAGNGLKAVNMLREMPTRSDVVLMDFRMPVMDGLEATSIIRNELALKDLPIVALTGELVDESWAAMFSAIVNKPADVNKLREALVVLIPDWKEPTIRKDPTGACR